MKSAILTGFIASLLFVSLIVYPLPAIATVSDSTLGKPQIVSGFGKIPGQDLFVHVVVSVPSGADKNEFVNDALGKQGARPFDQSEFKLNGLKWTETNGVTGDVFIEQFYNSNNQPTGALQEFMTTQSTWTNVESSNFEFKYGGLTSNCPSLVRECAGPQYNDGQNDVAWMPLNGKNTLGVTWYDTSAVEADMAMNTKFNWTTDGSGYDIQTVFLHENGHVLGLSHSETNEAVMYAYYGGENRILHNDDKCGIQELYGTKMNYCTTDSNPTPTDPSPTEPGSVDKVQVEYNGKGGKLQVNVYLTSNNDLVPNTSITIQMTNGNGTPVSDELTKNTDSSGKASWTFVGVSGGEYCTKIINVDGTSWTTTEQNTVDPCYAK